LAILKAGRARRNGMHGLAAVVDPQRRDRARLELRQVLLRQPAAGLLRRPPEPPPGLAAIERLGPALDQEGVGRSQARLRNNRPPKLPGTVAERTSLSTASMSEKTLGSAAAGVRPM